ncbi:MAG: cytochrome c [Rhizobium sp.]|uniref:cytochrome c n=1 Tax=Rhizobium sp. TaxID=391 RepID=UPI00055B3254
MKRTLFALHLSALSLAFSPAWAQTADQADQINNGRYQAILGDCSACHTTSGGKDLAGGKPLQTPFGPLVPPNITPDRTTGIGAWSKEDFRRAMKEGIGHGGKRLYPAMPYTAYTKMSDKDVDDLWAYLETVEPVSNAVEANQLPFPFNIRLSLLGWNTLNFNGGEFQSDPSQTVEWNRGAYIVQGPAHCGACHTPKSFMGADKAGQDLQGASLQGWYAPNITGNPVVGIGGWDDEEIVTYLKSGVNSHTIASGPMAEAVEASTSKMTDLDLRAIAVYLKSIDPSPAATQSPTPADDPRMISGGAIYRDNCSACHGGQGKGGNHLFPSLASNSMTQQPNVETLARIVIAGTHGVGTTDAPTTPSMPSFGWRLNDQQIADVLTYVRNSWGNSAAPVSADQVTGLRMAE